MPITVIPIQGLIVGSRMCLSPGNSIPPRLWR